MQVEPPLVGEMTQALDAVPWVRCASGNVSPVLGSISDCIQCGGLMI